MARLNPDQQLRHDELTHRWAMLFGKSRRRRRIRVALAGRARLGFAVLGRRAR